MIEEISSIEKNFSLTQRQFFALIQLAIHGKMDNCLEVCKVDWPALYNLAEKQSLVGICWGGIEKLPKEKLPPMDWIMEWLGQAEYIKEQNDVVNKAVEETFRRFNGLGIQGVLLKGQGLGQLYPQPELRTSGDIDFLVINPDIKRIIELAHKNIRSTGSGTDDYIHALYHHCDYGKIKDIEVETHWRASWFYTPWYNKRFQEFCKEHIADSKNWSIFKSGSDPDLKETLEIPTPSLAFNRVYVLVHIYRHLFTEGIGLRQIIDYYMVLQASAKDPMWAQQKIETMQRLKELGMERFTKAIMWIMKEALGLEDYCLLCTPSERDGQFLLSEVMQSGNFGKTDKRYIRRKGESFLHYAFRKILRNFRLFNFGPWEVICTPFWRTWHYFWMKRHNR